MLSDFQSNFHNTQSFLEREAQIIKPTHPHIQSAPITQEYVEFCFDVIIPKMPRSAPMNIIVENTNTFFVFVMTQSYLAYISPNSEVCA